MKKEYIRIVSQVLVLIIFPLTIFSLYRLYDSKTRVVFRLQKYAFEKKWNRVIGLHETTPSRNLIGQYFYNIALSETDQLCERLFCGMQDFGALSLILPWKQTHLNRGAYFYYSIGLINEAQRWAYESMVVYGYQPQNVKLLVKTNLINGNYRMAEKYINILKRTLNYRNWVKEYEKMLYEPEIVKHDHELGEKLKLLPKEDFFIQTSSPLNNIQLLLKANPTNKNAFEYEMAWYLLTKNVEAVVNNIKNMKEIGYDSIPQHIEEAALVYLVSIGELPDMDGLTISQETRKRFELFVFNWRQNSQNPISSKKNMNKKFGNTFWYYFYFE